MFDVSWSAGFCWFAPAAEPTVVSPGLTDGPLLFPG
jgi:hypothetical protein